MARKIYKPEEIIAKLRQVEVLTSQGKSAVDAIRSIGVTDATFYRWRQEYGGKRCSAALRLQVGADGFQHQGMSSSIWAWGQPLTRRVSRSVK